MIKEKLRSGAAEVAIVKAPSTQGAVGPVHLLEFLA